MKKEAAVLTTLYDFLPRNQRNGWQKLVRGRVDGDAITLVENDPFLLPLSPVMLNTNDPFLVGQVWHRRKQQGFKPNKVPKFIRRGACKDE